MLILGDEEHYHGRFPWVTGSLVLANVLVFMAQVGLGESFTNGFSLVPAEITSFQDLQGTKYQKVKVEVRGHYDRKGHYQPRYETKQFPIKHYAGPFPIFLTLFTSMFMHGDVFHLIGNMWFLFIFGRNVECAMSHGRFLAFYVACGIIAGLAHVASGPNSIIPCLGASGAIAGVMGAYVSIHPLNYIKIWLGWMIGVVEVPALIVIGLWFVIQYLSAFLTHDSERSGGVAYWSHLGGFVAGIVIIRAVVFWLQRQHERGELTEDEPLAQAVEAPLDNTPPADSVPNPMEPGAAADAGAADPFATFLSVQTFRKMQEQKQQEQPSGHG